jgi:predicted LPLAT superfamily acyltransferase
MSKLFYTTTTLLTKIMGRWIFVLFAWFVATGYFLFFPRRVGNSVQVYRALYPYRSRLFHLGCTWRQFHNFTDVVLDRFVLQQSDDITYTSSGLERLEHSLAEGRGAILLMSHMGNWEVGAHLLKRRLKGTRLLLYMGARQKEQIERIQKQSLVQNDIRILAVDENGGSPLDIVEGIRFVQAGGVVSLSGDLVWKKDQRTVPVKFLGHEIEFPQAPHVLALVSGAPVFIFFAFRTGKNRYQFSMSPPGFISPGARDQREAAIQRSAQRYADALEKALRRYPLQWYHFEPFLTIESKPAGQSFGVEQTEQKM